MSHRSSGWIRLIGLLLGLLLLAGCGAARRPDAPSDTLSADEIVTLNSLEKLDDYPLYTMKMAGAYAGKMQFAMPHSPIDQRSLAWGCSLFATLADGGERLYGRNYDWRFSPALLLFADPPEGYASVSMVDIEYLGYERGMVEDLLALPLEERRPLLDAFRLPFDGMNERGLVIGMAAVPAGEMERDPRKPDIGQLRVIREILDHAATVAEAVEILGVYNIDMSEVPIHYLIASAAGEAALVEFYQGDMVVTYNSQPWHSATNFLVASTDGKPAGQCPRYDRIQARMDETQGLLTSTAALDLLDEVSQENTQWSVVYNMNSGAVQVVMGRQFDQEVITLELALVR